MSLSELFAPGYVGSDPKSVAAVNAWDAANLKSRPAADPGSFALTGAPGAATTPGATNPNAMGNLFAQTSPSPINWNVGWNPTMQLGNTYQGQQPPTFNQLYPGAGGNSFGGLEAGGGGGWG